MAKKSLKAKVPVWSLKALYKSLKDPKITKDIKDTHKRALKFKRNYRNKVAKKVSSVQSCLEALQEFEWLQQQMAKPVIFASLSFSCNQTDPKYGSFLQAMRKQWTETNQELVFFELELLSLSKVRYLRFLKAKALRGYRNYLQKLLDSKDYILTEKEEQIFSDFGLTGRSAFVRLYSEERTALKYDVKVKGKKKTLSESELLKLMSDPNRKQREEAARVFTNGLKSEGRRLSFIFNMLLEDKSLRDRYRGFPNPEESRHQANQISKRVVDTMTSAVVDSYPVVHKYYRFKAKVLGVKKLAYYDRLAPVTKSEQKFSFSQAKSLILDAFERFSAEYAGIAEEFFDRGWIDAAPSPTKRSGAYCSFVTPDLNPYVFMTFKGTLRDVFTLAHELGHAIHARLMAGTGYLNFSFPLTVAETASIFSEMLLFEHLLDIYQRPEDQFSLHASSVENRFGSVFRQISMHQFEQLFHAARRSEGEQSVEAANKLWIKTQKAMYGSSLDFKGEYDYWWSYVPHFIHTPFYVYAYAFGELLSIALFQRYKKQGETFVDSYLAMLAAGGGASPEELLKPLGIRLQSRAFWQGGLDYISQQVGETINLYRKL